LLAVPELARNPPMISRTWGSAAFWIRALSADWMLPISPARAESGAASRLEDIIVADTLARRREGT
jgi:hypothetical protein